MVSVFEIFRHNARRIFFQPTGDLVKGCDSIFVLGPPTSQRLEAVESIHACLDRPPVYIFLPYLSLVPSIAAHSHVIDPVPRTTAGEAIAISRMMDAGLIHRPVVITTATHVSRARWILRRRIGNRISVVGVRPLGGLPSLLYQVLYQSAAFARAFLRAGVQEHRF